MTATLLRSPHAASCSRAAARKVSPAASSTDRFCSCSHFASLPIEVVLPAPLTPVSMITNGRSGPMTRGFSSGPMRSTSEPASSVRGSASSPLRRQRALRSAMRCAVASTPTSPARSASSSASSASSSSLRRTNTPVSAPASLARDSPRPDFSRSVQERDSAGVSSAGFFLNRSNNGGSEARARTAAKLRILPVPSASPVPTCPLRPPNACASSAGAFADASSASRARLAFGRRRIAFARRSSTGSGRT